MSEHPWGKDPRAWAKATSTEKQAVVAEITAMIGENLPFTSACSAAGIDAEVVTTWALGDQRLAAHLRRASAKAELALVRKVEDGSKSAMFQLERVHKDNWSLRESNARAAEGAIKKIYERLPDEWARVVVSILKEHFK